VALLVIAVCGVGYEPADPTCGLSVGGLVELDSQREGLIPIPSPWNKLRWQVRVDESGPAEVVHGDGPKHKCLFVVD